MSSKVTVDKKTYFSPFVAPDATLAAGALVRMRTKIWGLAQVKEQSVLGISCIIGWGVNVRGGVFEEPGAVLMNDFSPGATDPDSAVRSATDRDALGATRDESASIGARAVRVAPLHNGQWAVVAAGAVVTKDVKNFSWVRRDSARHAGSVGNAGQVLILLGGLCLDPVMGQTFREPDGELVMDEGVPL